MAEDGERRGGDSEDAGVHHDQLNEFGEETWTALGENPQTLNAAQSLAPPSGSFQTSEETLEVPISSPTLPVPSNIIIRQDSVETYENKDFLTEEVDTLTSSSNIEVKVAMDVDVGRDKTEASEELLCRTLTQDEASLSSLPKLGDFCRICHESNKKESYISPCECRGSLSLVHRSCLERWLAQCDFDHCELCGYNFRLVRIPKYSVLSSVSVWTRAASTWRERRNLIIDMSAFLVCCPIVVLCNFLSLKVADAIFSQESISLPPVPPVVQSQECEEGTQSLLNAVGQMSVFSMIGTMNLAFFLWTVNRGQYHARRWYSWYRRNSQVKLLGYPEVNLSISDEQSTSSSNNIRSISF